jgi:YHS domain-containing protein
MKPLRYALAAAALALAVFGAGCQKQAGDAPAPKKSKDGHDHEHAHPEEGPHGGPLAEWGEHDFHAEFTVDHKSKMVLVYVLDGEAKKAPKFDATKITKVTLTISNVSPPLTLELKHDASKTDSRGIAFATTHDQFAKDTDYKGTISGIIDGLQYSGEFKAGGHGHEKKKTGHDVETHPGGVHVAFAQGRYYAEAVMHKGGSVHLFLFGKDMSKVVEAESQKITAYVRKIGEKEFVTFELRPEPLEGDGKGLTSRFTGEIPKDLWNQDLEITIPALKLGSERYHLAFQTVDKPGDGHDAKLAMPTSKAEEDEERKLYLTAAGIYTNEDIKANGNVIASEKFKGFKATHDIKPKVGDKICPVTLTKANPECTWIIAGKKYEFCCPPCVEEFVKLAKESPKDVKQPEEYVKKQ